MDVGFVANFGTLSEHEARLWSEWATGNCVENRMRESDGAWQLAGLLSAESDAISLRRKLRTLADKWGSPLPAKLGHGWLRIISAKEFHDMTREEDVRKEDVLPPNELGSHAHGYTYAACGASVLDPSFAASAKDKLQLLLGKQTLVCS